MGVGGCADVDCRKIFLGEHLLVVAVIAREAEAFRDHFCPRLVPVAHGDDFRILHFGKNGEMENL